MKLSYIVENMEDVVLYGDSDVEVLGLSADSGKVKVGDLFFCYVGEKIDSHEYVAEAESSGAVAVVCERKLDIAIPQIIAKDARRQMAKVARVFYGFPDKKLKIVGVTGTNGKTTTTYMLDSIFKVAKKNCAVIGTLGISYAGKFIAPELTTPDPIFLHSVFFDMVKCGVEYVFMEVSAHALHFDKVDGISFEVGIFTNCTQDHLDFFKSMALYAKAKKKMFEGGRCKYAVINSDDELGLELIVNNKNAISYGIENPADVFAVNITESISGSKFVINLFDELYDISLNICALHNVYNAMSAATCAKILGIDTADIALGLNNLKSVSGRLERVDSFNGGEIFVDFAHTPDGLEKTLKALKGMCQGKLYCLFGCGGNRDRLKRPIMGEIAGKYSDFCIITSDNPRFEDPYDIICEIEKGVILSGKPYVSITQRETAIAYALKLLEKGDILLVAGKGGECYQEIMGIKHSYNDNIVIKKIIGC
jgi:UDP-N-acetylmuramoyl-L-alanyl-D-glutamate--2,6-diaminopimelate ligase